MKALTATTAATAAVCHYEELSVSVHVNYGQYADLREADKLTKALALTGAHTYPDLGQGAYWDDNPHGSSLNVRVGNDGLQVYVSTGLPGAADQAAAIAKLELNP